MYEIENAKQHSVEPIAYVEHLGNIFLCILNVFML